MGDAADDAPVFKTQQERTTTWAGARIVDQVDIEAKTTLAPALLCEPQL